jgi:hypothetical protein
VVRYSLLPRLTVIAPTAAEAVRYAGGWLFDQVLAGWDVTVITADAGDPRPLRILGVRHRRLDVMLAMPEIGPCLEAVAVHTDLYAGDERVRRLVLAAAGTGRAEIRLWGGAWPDDFGAARPLAYRLSLAAQAFKANALAAAAVKAGPAGGSAGAFTGAGGPTADTEVFLRGEVRAGIRLPARPPARGLPWSPC